eukprot:7535082-Pyramimonas_sp.AAC.1
MLTPCDAEKLIENVMATLSEDLKQRIDQKASLEVMGVYTDNQGRQNTRSLISKGSLIATR